MDDVRTDVPPGRAEEDAVHELDRSCSRGSPSSSRRPGPCQPMEPDAEAPRLTVMKGNPLAGPPLGRRLPSGIPASRPDRNR
jgi:hypothetical protein